MVKDEKTKKIEIFLNKFERQVARVVDYENLVVREKNYLYQVYFEKIGLAKIKCFQGKLEIDKIKKRIDIILRLKNEGKPKNLGKVEIEINELFSKENTYIKQQMDLISKVLKFCFEVKTKKIDENKRKDYFTRIVKLYHPNLLPQTPNRLTILNKAKTAFSYNNLQELERICKSIEDDKYYNLEDYLINTTEDNIDRLSQYLADKTTEINILYESLLHDEPFSYVDELQDENHIKEEKLKYEEQIEMYKEIYDQYAERFTAIVRY